MTIIEHLLVERVMATLLLIMAALVMLSGHRGGPRRPA